MLDFNTRQKFCGIHVFLLPPPKLICKLKGDMSFWHSCKIICRSVAFNSIFCLFFLTVWEVRFHPLSPDNLFTCSEDGSLWHWDGTSVAVQSTTGFPGASKSHFSGISNGAGVGGGYDSISPWLSVDATKHKMETFSLLPYNRLSINSLDIQSRHLLSGSDCEAIFIVKDLIIRWLLLL